MTMTKLSGKRSVFKVSSDLSSLGLGKRESNPIWFWRHLFANISLKMLGIHKVFLCFLPHLGRKSVCQNCLHLKKMRFACSQVFLRRRNTSVFQGEKRLNVREAHFLRHIGFDSLLPNYTISPKKKQYYFLLLQFIFSSAMSLLCF